MYQEELCFALERQILGLAVYQDIRADAPRRNPFAECTPIAEEPRKQLLVVLLWDKFPTPCGSRLESRHSAMDRPQPPLTCRGASLKKKRTDDSEKVSGP